MAIYVVGPLLGSASANIFYRKIYLPYLKIISAQFKEI